MSAVGAVMWPKNTFHGITDPTKLKNQAYSEKCKDVKTSFKNNFFSSGTFLVVLFLIVVFIVALCKVSDPDAWLHLSLGKLIWELKGLPELEPFTYPALETPFYYSSWLFGILCYALDTHFGVYGLVLLKATVLALAFYILLKDSLRPYNNYVVAVIVMTAALVLSDFRFVLRPDMFFMVFLSFSIFSLNAFLYDNKKYIYLLPIVHMLWANTHSSITVMFVPFFAFIGGGLIQKYLGGKGINFQHTPSSKQLRIMALVFFVSLAATLLNPYFTGQYFYGSQFLSTPWYTQNIIELRPLDEERKLTLYAITVVVLASFLLTRKRFSLIHFFLVVPFLFLAFNSIRFIFIIAITAFPVMARNIAGSLESKGWKPSKVLTAVAVACVVLYGSVTVARSVGNRQFGFGFNYVLMPRGAVEYMDRKNIYGKVLNPFHFGQYITWESYPRRTVFVDARGHLPVDMLDKMLRFKISRPVLDGLYEEYGFESVLIDYANSTVPYAPSSHPRWALVYWDDTALLYLRRGGRYDAVVRDDEYRFVKPEMSPLHLGEDFQSEEYMDNLIDELARTVHDTGSSRAHTLLGFAYYTAGEFEPSLEHFISAIGPEPRNTTAHYGLGLLYRRLGDPVRAKKHFQKCLKIERSGWLADEAKNRLAELSDKPL
jgi:hypothetical protein